MSNREKKRRRETSGRKKIYIHSPHLAISNRWEGLQVFWRYPVQHVYHYHRSVRPIRIAWIFKTEFPLHEQGCPELDSPVHPNQIFVSGLLTMLQSHLRVTSRIGDRVQGKAVC